MIYIENHMVIELPNAPWNQEDEYEPEIETKACKYCGDRRPADEMNSLPTEDGEEHCCIDCLGSENE